MLKNTNRISTLGMGRDEWLARRRNGIGGSDAAAIVGLNPYSSPYSVWADKCGYSQDIADNEAMRQGRELEGYVAARFCEATGKNVHRVNQMIQHPEHAWMLGNIDRKVIGEHAGLECKTSKDIHLMRYRNGEYPPEYYVQCLHYMAVSGYRKWYLAVLVYGTDLLHFEINWDDDEIAELIRREKAFWDGHILTHIPPPADGSDATSNALAQVHPRPNGQFAPCDTPELLEQYTGLNDQIRALNTEKKRVANQIKAMIGDNTSMGSTTHLACWLESNRTDCDLNALAAAHPNIDLEQYTHITTSRRLNVKQMEGA